jgi:hypothetical protein
MKKNENIFKNIIIYLKLHHFNKEKYISYCKYTILYTTNEPITFINL